MLYFKNPELAENYHVSLRTVLNWIEAAKQGKLELELYEQKGRFYIANTTKNVSTIENMVTERKKYRNTRGFKVISPKPAFYKLFTDQQLFDIVAGLETYHEIQRQYNYFDGGADYWDKYANRMATEQQPNLLTSTIKLFLMNQSYIDDLLSEYKRVNVVDVGVGNSLPVKGFIERLLAQGRLGRYIALDISPKMLEIAKRNVEDWFGGKVKFEGYQRDINYVRFADLLIGEYVKDDAQHTVNLVLVLGGTLGNLRSPDSALKVIQSSMGRSDLFIQSLKLDTSTSRRFFDFNITPGVTTLSPNHRFIFDMLNIDSSFYDVEMGYDPRDKQRYIQVRLKIALSLVFDFAKGKRVVELNKGDTILLWRYWHQDAFATIRQLDRDGFHLLHASETEDQEYMLTISRVASSRAKGPDPAPQA